MKPTFFLKAAQRGQLTMRLSLALTLLVAGTPLLLSAGCGGGGNDPLGQSAPTRKTGGLTLSVTWPDRSRLIPDASESIVVTVRKANATLKTTTLQRPAAGQPLTTTASFDDLPVGTDYTVTAEAFPLGNGTGVAQARTAATVPFTVTDNARTKVGVTMDSTIATLSLEPVLPFPLGAGRNRILEAVARDAGGNVVLLSQNKVQFALTESVSGTATLTPDATTVASDANLVVTNAPTTGSVTLTVTATDPESGKTATLDVLVSSTGISEDATWAKFHGDLQNTGRLAQSLPALSGTPSASSLFTTSSQIVFASPVIDKDGTVYIGAYDGQIRAINPDGSLKWSVATGAEIESTPVLSKDGALYVGSNDGKLYCVETATGATRFAFQADGPIYGSPTVSEDGIVFFGTTGTGSTMYAVDGLSGAEVWLRRFGTEGIQTTPAMFGTGSSAILYFGASDGKVYGINAVDGQDAYAPFQTTDAGDVIFSSSCAVAQDGSVYFGTLGGKLYGLNPNLTQRWVFDAGAPIYATPAINLDSPNGPTVYVGTLDNFSGLNQSKFFAINSISGDKRFEFLVGDGITASAAIGFDNTIYITSFDRNLYALNSDFSVKFQTAIGGATPPAGLAIESSPGFGPDGAIYFGSTDGTVQVVR